jgi:hypothetical protein
MTDFHTDFNSILNFILNLTYSIKKIGSINFT